MKTHWTFLLALAAPWVPPVAAEDAQPAAPPPRIVFIALDAVPYEVVAELTDEERGEAAIFRRFKPPVPLISTFPSTSNLAFGGILERLGVEHSPGYESRFFDRRANRRRGGGPRSYFRIRFPWRDFFDWRTTSLFRKTMRGFHPVRSNLRAIDRSLEAFLASEQRVYFIYYGGTDLLGHMHGPRALEAVLRGLDRDLEELRRRTPNQPFYAVLFSDHGQAGGTPLKNVRRDLKQALAAAGYRVAGRLRGPRDVVFMPYGLVSSLVLFTREGEERPVAEIAASTAGVEFCVAASAGGWRVESRRGSAEIRRRDGDGIPRWSYRRLSGDPLQLGPLLAAAGDGEVWRSDRWWLRATRDRAFPDPLYRISRAFDLVDNPASVICSLAPGHMYGAIKTELLARISIGRLRWTHGALERQASLGFVLSDLPGWQPDGAVRFSDALAPFARPAGLEVIRAQAEAARAADRSRSGH